MEFFAGGVAEGRLYDEDGTTLLNTVRHDYGSERTGGMALQTFARVSADTIEVCR